MDINEIRFKNYRTLMAQYRDKELDRGEVERGLLNRFGRLTGISPRYLSHVNNARKHLGGDTCRRMEQAFHLPYGWMDQDHLAAPAHGNKAERDYVELALKLFRESPLEAQSVLLRYMGERVLKAASSEPRAKKEGAHVAVESAGSTGGRKHQPKQQPRRQRKRRATSK